MILGFLFSIQNFLKHCKALSTEKYRRYMNILLLLLLLLANIFLPAMAIKMVSAWSAVYKCKYLSELPISKKIHS